MPLNNQFEKAEWKNRDAQKALLAANELSYLFERRKNIAKGKDTRKPKVDLSRTYLLTDRLEEHCQILKKVAKRGERIGDYWLQNYSFITALVRMYNIESDNNKDLASGLVRGLEDIITRFEEIERLQTTIPLKKIKKLIDDCLDIFYVGAYWQNQDGIDFYTLRLAA